MRITLTILAGALAAATALPVAGCGKSSSSSSSGGDQAAAASGDQAAGKPVAGPDYGGVDKLVAAARTGDDFTNVTLACGKLQMDAATSGVELAKDPTYQDHCRIQPAHARAQLAIKESTPDKMSVHCLSASMELEELVKDGLDKDQAQPLDDQVKKACGM